MALIYPFVWQHALIPVLPSDLVDFCCSPLPFMMGILPACLKKMDDLDMEEDVCALGVHGVYMGCAWGVHKGVHRVYMGVNVCCT